LSSGPGVLDGSRILNQTAVGVRYQGLFNGIGVLAYAVYEVSGHANYTGLTTASFLGNTVAGTTYTGKYAGFNFGNGGIALTYGGFTIGANAIGGRLNGLLALTPQGGAPEVAYMVGAKYTTGPLVMGVAAEHGDYQGSESYWYHPAARFGDRFWPGLHCGARIPSLCRISVPDHLSGRFQLYHERGGFRRQQQHPVARFSARQCRELLNGPRWTVRQPPSNLDSERCEGRGPWAAACAIYCWPTRW
jgi:hypothetical protein